MLLFNASLMSGSNLDSANLPKPIISEVTFSWLQDPFSRLKTSFRRDRCYFIVRTIPYLLTTFQPNSIRNHGLCTLLMTCH
jgi:hypothetical protein